MDINNTLITILGYPLSYVECIGTLTGLVSVWFAARSNIWTWPIGLINITCFFVIFFQIRLYADMFLQVYFFAMSIYGWMRWHRQSADAVPVGVMSGRGRILAAVIIAGATAAVGTFVKNIHEVFPGVFAAPASYPYVDTFVAVLSVVATVLLAQRKLETWPLWIVVDITSVLLYARKNVLLIAIEYAVFLAMAVFGLFHWLRLYRYEKRIGVR